MSQQHVTLQVSILFIFQLKEFKMKYAEAMGHFATLARMIEEEMSVNRASRDLDEKLIQVILFHSPTLLVSCMF